MQEVGGSIPPGSTIALRRPPVPGGFLLGDEALQRAADKRRHGIA
jgi:hypothetical protein